MLSEICTKMPNLMISVKNVLSDAFPCQGGVRQGENLSPLPFAIYSSDFKTFLSEKYNGLH